jgi:hypothetical protein
MSSKRIIAVFVLIELVIVLIGYLTEGFTLAALQTITRFSGRLSLVLFSVIFLFYNRRSAISPWLSDRFYLLFAIVHGIHLIELLLFVSLSGMQLVPYRVAGGILAYLFVFAMPILQVYKERARVTARSYATAEIIFIYYVWLVFFLTYLPRVQGKVTNAGGTFAEHVALLGWVSTLLGMKLAGLIQFQKSRPNKRS